MNLIAKFFLVLYLFSSSIYPLEILPKEDNDNFIENLNNSNSNISLNNDDYILGPGDIFKLNFIGNNVITDVDIELSLIHISEPTRPN